MINSNNPKAGYIVSAYQGMGKSTITKNNKDAYIDLESSNYDKSDSDWAKKYVSDAIKEVTENGYSVCFVSSHKIVLEELIKSGHLFIIFYPLIDRDTMNRRLANRYFEDKTIKNASALANSVLDYENNIEHLRSYVNSIGSSDGLINAEILEGLSQLPTYDSRVEVINRIISLKNSKQPKINITGEESNDDETREV